jgi:hypothetical protein
MRTPIRPGLAALVAVLLAAGASRLDATGIVAFHRPDLIVLAADSGVWDTSDIFVRADQCKIVAGPHVAMAFAGEAGFTAIRLDNLSGTAGTRESFNAFEIAKRVVRRAASVSDAMALFPQEGAAYLQALAVKPGPPSALHVMIAGFDGKQPVIVIIDVSRGGTGLNFDLRSCPPDCPSGGLPVAIGVIEDSLVRATWAELAVARPEDLEQSARTILERQALAWKARGGEGLAPPFDVLEIGADGMHWRGPHKKECSEG